MAANHSTWLRMAIAVCLGFEVLRHAVWLGRILSFLVVYDVTVLAMVALRAAVTAMQASAAWSLWREAPAGATLARWSLGASALLITFELGFGLSPSSVTPGLRWPTVVAYAAYAGVAGALSRRLRPA